MSPLRPASVREPLPLRDLIVFARHNLVSDPPFLRQDLVTCRNVLIYFDVPTKKRILAHLRSVLREDGCLLLGGAEAILDLDGNFGRQAVGQATVYRRTA